MKGNHNKDYSVVKTFGSPLRHKWEGFFLAFRKPLYWSISFNIKSSNKKIKIYYARIINFLYIWGVKNRNDNVERKNN